MSSRDTWQLVRVDDLIRSGALFINDGYRVTNAELGQSGTPFIRGGDIRDGGVNTDVTDHVMPEFNARIANKRSAPEDVVFITKGTVGRVGFLRPEQPEVVFAPQVCYWRVLDRRVLCPRFVFYLLQGRQFQANLDAVRTHGSMLADYVSLTDQRHFRLTLPPIPQQERIAEVLGALDDKSELTRHLNRTLEAMARAFFKSWFVAFDPVRKGHPLFPRSFTQSTLGDIPEGWKAAELGALVEVIDCLHSKKPERQLQGRPLLQLDNILDNGLLDMTDTYFISADDYSLWTSRMEACAGDCVITNVGRVGAVAQVPEGLKAALGRNMTGLRCREDFPYPTFLIECLLSSTMREEITSKIDAGTILESLNVRNIPKLRVIEPAKPVAAEFERICRPWRAKMERNLEESGTLAALRDALLPNLLSGEIRVKQAEKIVGEAV